MSLRLSVSKTKTFLGCKKKYDFVYNLKFPKKEYDYHTLGKFCHKILEDFHIAYINGSKEPFNVEMTKAYKAALNEYKEKMTVEMKSECRGMIDQYLKLVSEQDPAKAPNVIACEKNFEFMVEDIVLVNGMIDRIQIDPDGIIHVCDYKTSKPNSAKYLKKDWFQLLTYAYSILLENPNIEKVRCSYIMLRLNFEYFTKEFNKKEILEIYDTYKKYANEIIAEKEFKPNPTVLCGYCEYVPHCEAGQKQTRVFNGEVGWT